MTAGPHTPTTLSQRDEIRQSLADGPAGTALLHLERALTGTGDWAAARRSIRQAASGDVDGGDHAGLYFGAPALAFMLRCAARGDDRYAGAAARLGDVVDRLAARRLTAAEARLDAGAAASFREYDLFYGLTGIGALLLDVRPGGDALARLLRYVTRLVRPRRVDGLTVPGWWVRHDPDPLRPTPGGHLNLGMAHGAAGLLALLATATRRGCVVDGHADAIAALTGFFDWWRQDGDDGPWWPQWLTAGELRTGRTVQPGPGGASWCYGTPGIARALHLAALATGDTARRDAAEHALAACLTDRAMHHHTDGGLCHGAAGVYQTAYRAAADAHTPAIGARLPALAAAVTAHAVESGPRGGLLTGNAGVQLAALTAQHPAVPPRSGWDSCLLIT